MAAFATRDDGPAIISSTVRLEVRLAERFPEPGYIHMSSERTGATAFVGDDVVLSNADVTSAIAVEDEARPHSMVEVTLSPGAALRFGELTRGRIGQPLALLLNGRLISAPTVRAEIWNGRLRVDGRFDRDEARRVASGLAR